MPEQDTTIPFAYSPQSRGYRLRRYDSEQIRHICWIGIYVRSGLLVSSVDIN